MAVCIRLHTNGPSQVRNRARNRRRRVSAPRPHHEVLDPSRLLRAQPIHKQVLQHSPLSPPFKKRSEYHRSAFGDGGWPPTEVRDSRPRTGRNYGTSGPTIRPRASYSMMGWRATLDRRCPRSWTGTARSLKGSVAWWMSAEGTARLSIVSWRRAGDQLRSPPRCLCCSAETRRGACR